MGFYQYSEIKDKIAEIIDEANLSQKPIFIQSINKHGAVVLSLETFFTMHQAYHASLKILKK